MTNNKILLTSSIVIVSVMISTLSFLSLKVAANDSGRYDQTPPQQHNVTPSNPNTYQDRDWDRDGDRNGDRDRDGNYNRYFTYPTPYNRYFAYPYGFNNLFTYPNYGRYFTYPNYYNRYFSVPYYNQYFATPLYNWSALYVIPWWSR